MSRHATPLNIPQQPGIGMAYVVKNLQTKKLVRVSAASHRDVMRPRSKIKVLRAFSGDEPFFYAKIGSLNTDITPLKFLCGESHKKCRDESGTYEWTGITVKEALKKNLKFEEPNKVPQKEASASTRGPGRPRKMRRARITQTEAPTAPSPTGTVKRGPGRPRKVVPGSTAAAVAGAGTESVITVQVPVEIPAAQVSAALGAQAHPATKPATQQDTEFEAEVEGDFQNELAKAGAKT